MAALAMLVMSAAISQNYYKWTDAKGVTHYSEQPPSIKAQQIKLRTSESPLPVSAATITSPEALAVSLDAAKRDFKKQACATAHSNLQLLSSQAMVLDTGSVTKPADVSSARKLSLEQRDAAKVDAQKQIDEFCNRG
jgi:hypothetical protein